MPDLSEFIGGYNKCGPCLKQTLPFLVAELVYQCQEGVAQKVLPSNHPLFSSTFWRSGVHTKVNPDNIIRGCLVSQEDGMSATGVPPSIRISIGQEELSRRVQKSSQELADVKAELVELKATLKENTTAMSQSGGDGGLMRIEGICSSLEKKVEEKFGFFFTRLSAEVQGGHIGTSYE